MVMDAKTIDLICALLTIPVAYKVCKGAKEGEYGEDELRKVVNSYFRLREIFEDRYYKR